ncbi:hypothetical protein GINT2_002021 [Glugoides intestinalis]
MEYIAAFSLVSQNNNKELSADAIKVKIIEILNSINAPVCTESLDLFLSKVEGKSMTALIEAGSELMKSQVSTGTTAGASSDAAKTTAAVEDEKEESESEEVDLDFF